MDSFDESRQTAVGADPLDDPAWAQWRDTIEALPSELPKTGASEAGKDDRAENRPVTATALEEPRTRFATDQDFLRLIVQGIREDVLCGDDDEPVPAPIIGSAAPKQIATRPSPGTHAVVPVRAPERRSIRSVPYRVVGSSIRRTCQLWANGAVTRSAIVKTATVQTMRRLLNADWIAEARDRFDYYHVAAVGGLIVTALGTVAITAWVLFQAPGAPPTVLALSAPPEAAVSAPAPAPPAPPDVVAKPPRTVRWEWRAVRDFFFGATPPSTAAVASRAPSVGTDPPEALEVASSVRPGSAASTPSSRATRSTTQRRSAIAKRAVRDETPAPPANGSSDAVAPVSAADAAIIVESVASPSDASRSTPTRPLADRSARPVIYDARDSDVRPPRAAAQQLTGMWSPLTATEDPWGIAVVVNEAGTVDSVRSVNQPRTMAESLQLTSALSTVKSWQFRPATKDNIPVKYRLILPLRVATRP